MEIIFIATAPPGSEATAEMLLLCSGNLQPSHYGIKTWAWTKLYSLFLKPQGQPNHPAMHKQFTLIFYFMKIKLRALNWKYDSQKKIFFIYPFVQQKTHVFTSVPWALPTMQCEGDLRRHGNLLSQVIFFLSYWKLNYSSSQKFKQRM